MKQLILVINILIYIFILFSIYLIFKTSIEKQFNNILRFIYRKRKKTVVFQYFKKIYLSIEDIHDDRELESKVYNLYFRISAIFVVFFIVIFRYNFEVYRWYYAIFISLLPTVILALIPYFLLILKLYNTQRESSKEASIVVTEIYNQYRILNNNIVEALDKTINNLDDSIICKRYLLRLSMRIKEYQTDKELLEILDEFTFTVNTNWIRMLSDAIFFALVNNIDISLSLNGLIDQIGTINYTQNIGKQLNIEGFSMAKYLAPILYIILIFVTIKLLNIKMSDFLYQQFTGAGLKYFIIMVVLFIVSYVFEYFYKRRKFDF